MKKQFVFLVLLAASVSATLAQTPAAVSRLEQNLRQHVAYLASDKLEGRRTGEAGATLAGNYVAEQFRKAGIKPGVTADGRPRYTQAFSYTPVRDPHTMPAEPAGGSAAPDAKQAFNVIGILRGRDPVLKNEAIVIGAHYDHLGHGGAGSLAVNSTVIHHGADDNASGTAALIELARQFAKTKNNKRTIIFIAFSGEEDGLFGSKYYVNNPVWPMDRTIAMINLDMVGRLDANKLTVGGIGTAEGWRALVQRENAVPTAAPGSRAVGIPMVSGNGVATTVAHTTATRFNLQLNEDGYGPSDHSSFYGKQVPVLFFFTGTHLDYHKPSDTFEKINYPGLLSVVGYVAAIARSIDESAMRPAYKASAAPQQSARMGFTVSLGTIPSYADSTDGMVLDGVRDNSPAAKAGLKKDDKVVKLAGKEIKNVYDYTAALGEMKPDVEYEVVVIRGSERLALKIVPAAAARR